MIGNLLPAVEANHLWFAVPLIVVVSLVYSATRHEHTGPILRHAVRFAIWIIGFMAVVLAVFVALSWLA